MIEKFPKSIGTIHFVGIGGIGMSGIADILVNIGYNVSGSDLRENALTARLARKGVSIFTDHKAENVQGASVVVVSSAISNDNPEISEARRLKIPVVKRAEMLAELMKMKLSIAVAGTHGKTTTTSMVAAVLDQANMDPTVVNGGLINAYNSNSRLGSGKWIVVEADESDGSFVKLMPTIAVITNIDFDHVDNFHGFDELSGLFDAFAENVPFYGAVILCVDHPEVKKIAKKIVDRRVITYGLREPADIFARNIQLSSHGAEFDIVFSEYMVSKYKIAAEWKNFSLPMFGEHNISNALAAIAAGLELGISEDDMRIALGSFMGVKRRFTKVAEVNGVTIIDDYAHHPVEIEAVLRAARTTCRGKIFAVMQPHRHTRLKNFLDDFARVLELSDRAFVAPIYTAHESNNGVDHFTLLKQTEKNKKVEASFVKDVSDLATQIKPLLHPEDFVIFLGAGDITQWAYALPELLVDNPQTKE